MNTRVFRLNLAAAPDIATVLITACDKQLTEGFKLASTFVWGTDLILIFQKL
jgi:hypothetical protein